MSRDFRLEEHPVVLMTPSVVPPFGWVGHIPFAYLAVDLLRPACIVELGTHSGNSYLAMCQAVRMLALPSRCFAIDTWQGDSHASHYTDQVYQSLRARHDPRYGDFSQLLRSRFDDALEHFADHSVDLLHIDGLHTYEAVKHDFETWLPKLSDKAVVLLHDTAVVERGFGVRGFFEELSQRYPCFEFVHSNGLGVVAVGANVPEPFMAFLQQGQTNPAALRAFFEALASNLVDANGHARGGIHEPQPVVCHLYYRGSDESYDDARRVSAEVDASEGLLDVQFQLPPGISPAYLRIDPADFPGVYGLQQVRLQVGDAGPSKRLERLEERLGHVEGELLPRIGSQCVRFASFGNDPYIEFEVGSALDDTVGGAAVDVTARVEYEIVITEPSMHRLMERQALVDMRALSQTRVEIQNMARELTTRLAGIDKSIEGLAKRSLWYWLRRWGR
ncbi:hypothetical protein GCM10007862_30900 [Dyella lipolytica]|nr:class I SAM-dependent methyltransferase [Dyella lipolytica]GLQ48039.1 hypothetical protein GCM10007862_30900 [Dyella lipolytica]